jgi:hypothetical protein
MSLKVPKAGGPDLFKAGYKVSWGIEGLNDGSEDSILMET